MTTLMPSNDSGVYPRNAIQITDQVLHVHTRRHHNSRCGCRQANKRAATNSGDGDGCSWRDTAWPGGRTATARSNCPRSSSLIDAGKAPVSHAFIAVKGLLLSMAKAVDDLVKEID